jgi:hypothetical protein
MKKVHNSRKIAGIKRGQVITGHHMTEMSLAINANTRFLTGPKQQKALEDTENANAGSGDLFFTETSRTSTSVTITDSNGDTSSVEQIDRVDFRNSSGETLTLIFNNP